MNKIKQLVALLISVSVLSACTMVDDYMLGTDNTPKPSVLEKMKSKVAFNERWIKKTAPTAVKPAEFNNLTPVIQQAIIYSASSNGFVQARLKSTGKLLWSTNIKASITSGPNVNKNFVVVGSEASVVTLSIKEGRILWRAVTSNQLLAAPVLSHNRIYAKTIDGHLYAFQSQDGKQLWHYAHGAPDLILKANSAPVIAGELVLSGFSDGQLEAFNAKSGRLVWQRKVAYSKGHTSIDRMIDIDTTPLVKNNIVYIATYQGEVLALSLREGHTLWSHQMSTFKNMTLNEKALFIVDVESRVWALSLNTGMVLWQQKALINRGLNAPAVSSKGLVLTDLLGYLHVLSLETGEKIAQKKMAALKTHATPIVDDQDVYVLFENGSLTDYMMVR